MYKVLITTAYANVHINTLIVEFEEISEARNAVNAVNGATHVYGLTQKAVGLFNNYS